MSTRPLTPSQTVGPFFHHCLLRSDAQRNTLATPDTVGNRIRIEGYVYDGEGAAVPDAMIEIWQADGQGKYRAGVWRERSGVIGAAFLGYGRTGTDAAGAFWFETIKPGPLPFDIERLQAPHINVAVFARGLLNHLLTRLYFADEPANGDDPIMLLIPPERRATLLAKREAGSDGLAVYRFDIVLQGKGETVFFNLEERR
jgi:protocatechuate 3,4-dioxygenase alpha subunit